MHEAGKRKNTSGDWIILTWAKRNGNHQYLLYPEDYYIQKSFHTANNSVSFQTQLCCIAGYGSTGCEINLVNFE